MDVIYSILNWNRINVAFFSPSASSLFADDDHLLVSLNKHESVYQNNSLFI